MTRFPHTPHGRAFRDTYGPWAVVTGASSGIGRALAEALARRGVDLVLVARRGPLLDGLAAALAATHGVATRTVAADLARGVDPVLRATAKLDVGLLVAAAGFGTSGPFVDATLDVEHEMLAVNCGAVLDLTWHYSRRLAARGRGGIVLLSSSTPSPPTAVSSCPVRSPGCCAARSPRCPGRCGPGSWASSAPG